MNPNSCTREPEVIAALVDGKLADELQGHTGVCEVCSEIVRVTHALAQEVVAPPFAEVRPPDAAVVWRRAQSVAREQAIAKATQPIGIARIATLVAAAISLPWFILSPRNSPSWISDFTVHLKSVDMSFSSAATGTILLGAIGSLFVITLSSWFVLRQE